MKQLYTIIFTFISAFVFRQQAYYNSIDFSKTGLALKQDLADLITTTHTNILSYGWDATKATDINPSNSTKVLLVYGWENGSDIDCTNDLERDINSNGGNSCDYNREHVYAKSLATPVMDNSGPGADGHHIRASDVQRNGTRGNQKFASGSGNLGNVTGGWYPGDEWKGDVARIIMYMYLRYGDQCLPINVGVGSAVSTPDSMIDLFLQWNSEDEVSNYEIQRNEFHENTLNTYAQGNRNPFIDNPALATAIWGGPEATDTWGNILSTESFFVNTIKIYPNPNQENYLNIQTKQPTQVEFYNAIGQLLSKTNISTNNSKINITHLKTGIYLVKLTTESGTLTKKLVKR
ncbi:endonuclease [Gaetbulibacter saemankumensis]|uniref:endonuclease n=1 Tax=Gaetbulibacter saemankumensis TaxID=311208 RepID=UPI0003F644B2|nr:endonuclease [Gaetbulibacter saemankumensis]